jgi:hypothetical protein
VKQGDFVMVNVNSYVVDMVDTDCFDLYVSEDDGYTWEFYNWYSSQSLAEATGKDLMEGLTDEA